MELSRPISARTQLCAIIGNPVGHSMSPAIHNAAFKEARLDYIYVAFRVEKLRAAIEGFRALENFRGLSVTIPHKVEVLGYVDELGEVDRHIGSINTVVNEGGRLFGYGTDGPGALRALMEAGVDCSQKSVLFLGAGGAARAIAFTLANKAGVGAIRIVDVKRDVLEALLSDLRSGTAGVDLSAHLYSDEVVTRAMNEADIVVNCTPVGMHPRVDESPVPPELLAPGQVVFDIVYNPLETKLLADARRRGLKCVKGVEMFVNQAVLQFELFTGATAPIEAMRNVVLEKLSA